MPTLKSPFYSIAFAVCLLTFTASFAQADPTTDLNMVLPEYTVRPNDIKELTEAIELFRTQKLDDCLKKLEAAQKAYPQLPPAKVMLARLFLSAKNVAAGLTLLEQEAAASPNHPEVYLAFANIAIAQNRNTDAILHLEKMKSIQLPADWPTKQREQLDIQYHAGIGMVAERRAQWDKAEEHLNQWVKLDPKSTSAKDRLATAMFFQDKRTEAYDLLKQIYTMDQDSGIPEVKMANLYLAIDKPDKAREFLDYATTRYKDNPQVKAVYAKWLLSQGESAEAVKYTDMAIAQGMQEDDVRMTKALAHRDLNQLDEAETVLEQLYQKAPASFEYSNQLALVLVEQSQKEKQDKALQLAVLNARQFQRDPNALSTLGWVLFRTGKQDEGAKYLATAMTARQNRSEAVYFATRALLETGNTAAAGQTSKLLEKAINNPGVFVGRKEAKAWYEKNREKLATSDKPMAD